MFSREGTWLSPTRHWVILPRSIALWLRRSEHEDQGKEPSMLFWTWCWDSSHTVWLGSLDGLCHQVCSLVFVFDIFAQHVNPLPPRGVTKAAGKAPLRGVLRNVWRGTLCPSWPDWAVMNSSLFLPCLLHLAMVICMVILFHRMKKFIHMFLAH